MKLYDQVDRVHNELLELGIDEDSPLDVDDLTPFDQYHYHGTEAVDVAIAALDVTSSSHVLDVGSGIGGPARYIAAKTGCRVTALELQKDLHETAETLTRRCGLHKHVEHRCGNILKKPLEAKRFDAITSHLVFLHIPEKKDLFSACRGLLKANGTIFIEDFTKLREPEVAEWDLLQEKVLCPYLPTGEEYLAQLAEAGFEIISAHDMTESWRAFTALRLKEFRDNHDRNLRIHGPEITRGLEDFYATVAGLYKAQVLGGLRLVAKRCQTKN